MTDRERYIAECEKDLANYQGSDDYAYIDFVTFLIKQAKEMTDEEYKYFNRYVPYGDTSSVAGAADWQDNDDEYCTSCQQSPCMCSDREATSTTHDY